MVWKLETPRARRAWPDPQPAREAEYQLPSAAALVAIVLSSAALWTAIWWLVSSLAGAVD